MPILIAGFIALTSTFVAMAAAVVSQEHLRAAPAALPMPSATGAAPRRAGSKCPACGVIESLRTIEPAGGVPATYEITVRLRDGTTGVHRDASPANWRLGESVIFIEGGDSPGG